VKQLRSDFVIRGGLSGSGAVVNAARSVFGVPTSGCGACSMRFVGGETGAIADVVRDVLGVQVPPEL